MRTYKKKTRKQKTRKQDVIKNKQKKTQKGGLFIKGDPKQAFNFFIDNSEIELLNVGGRFSIILKANFKNNLSDSPYKKYNYSNYGENVNCLLIKIVALIDYPDNYIKKNDYIQWYNTDIEKSIDDKKNFLNEVKIQNDIFLKTVNFLEPICPGIVYHEIFDINDDWTIIRKIKEKMNIQNTNSLLDIIINIFQRGQKYLRKHIKLGIIVMELGENFKPLYLFKSNNNFENYKNMAKLQLYKMIKMTGYYHNDFHIGNILIDSEYEGIYDIKGKVLIIDFGFSHKGIYLPKSKSNLMDDFENQINDLIKNNNIQKLFNFIYNELYRPDNYKFDLEKETSPYKWITETDENKIKKLYDEEIEINKKKHAYTENNPCNPYPILPLDLGNDYEDYKNLFYKIDINGNEYDTCIIKFKDIKKVENIKKVEDINNKKVNIQPNIVTPLKKNDSIKTRWNTNGTFPTQQTTIKTQSNNDTNVISPTQQTTIETQSNNDMNVISPTQPYIKTRWNTNGTSPTQPYIKTRWNTNGTSSTQPIIIETRWNENTNGTSSLSPKRKKN